jgi:AcrR family transcriptional regulator
MEANKVIEGQPDTRDRLLNTAQWLFAEQGFKATSLRQITQEAGANVASVNYHFGSKEEMLNELIRRRVEPVNERRIALLEKYRVEAAGKPIPLEKIFEAFFLPFFQSVAPYTDKDTMDLIHIIERLSEQPTLRQAVYEEHFKKLSITILEALSETLPELETAEIHWRFHFALSLMLSSMSTRQRVEQSSKGLCDPEDIEGMVTRLINFICAGFHAE